MTMFNYFGTGVVLATGLLCSAGEAKQPNSAPQNLQCSATQTEWKSPRAFSVSFVEKKGKLTKVAVIEQDRVFTPGNIVASFSVGGRSGTGVVNKIPNQRPGKWSGTSNSSTKNFTLAAPDGAASFAIVPVEGEQGKYQLSWQADLNFRFGDEFSSEGGGDCMVQAVK